MNNQAVQRVANAYAPRFGIENDASPFLQITKFIKISMNNTGACFNYRYLAVVPNVINQSLTAARNQYVYITNGI